jgi:hypothetical protein
MATLVKKYRSQGLVGHSACILSQQRRINKKTLMLVSIPTTQPCNTPSPPLEEPTFTSPQIGFVLKKIC